MVQGSGFQNSGHKYFNNMLIGGALGTHPPHKIMQLVQVLQHLYQLIQIIFIIQLHQIILLE